MMSDKIRKCPDCEATTKAPIFSRRDFLRTASAGTMAAIAGGGFSSARPAYAADAQPPETVVKRLYDSLSEDQKRAVCFDWEYHDPQRGLLRTRISNNWHITKPTINSEFYTAEQRRLIRDIFEGIVQPEWHAKFDKQLQDDAGGFGNSQNVAIFGKPGEGKFEFVLTGRHITLRCDGNSAEHVAFGGPIFYGHAASGFNESPDHPGNVFWHQALAANKVYEMLDPKQRTQASVSRSPREEEVGFRGPGGEFPGVPVTELTADQKELLQQTLQKLIEPYRQGDRDEVVACLKAQGGLDKCALAFYTDQDLGSDRVWDNWRLEGPSFVWYFRGAPHVHVWVNVADNPAVKLNA
jgi:hypothetical protein